MKRFIETVTVTGADDGTAPDKIYALSLAYPFVEWGILLSKKNEGYPRFPSSLWLNDFLLNKHDEVTVSGHLCGHWVRDIVSGGVDFANQKEELLPFFDRFQLNFHGEPHHIVNVDNYLYALDYLNASGNQQIIYQRDGVNDLLFSHARSQSAKRAGLDAVPLYDISGGRGILPKDWPEPEGTYCGYAGGLSPANLQEQIDKLSKIVGDNHIWIDAETCLRTDDNQLLDLQKVVQFLEIAKPFVIGGIS
jgi:hypothetical protein